ncbi:hypothetical protein C3744_04080 [Priestia megaterium]|uniref:Uncharacterized protein n=1 Tax=Priestia megaterium TaxID=1404 RepID=A0A3D8X831_PRIMG|nr:hypothetical protein [Priestia megaterium]MDH3170260.1 hypothetical protein [Priestia megaterium]RDZ18065.1 hypothetical protein C3744_04080 [Priestia megaterium]
MSAVFGIRSIAVVFLLSPLLLYKKYGIRFLYSVIRFAIVLGGLVLCIIALILESSTSLNTIQIDCVFGIILLLALFFFGYIHNRTKKRKL